MNKIKVSFIGTGYMANEYAKVLTKKFPFKISLVGAINKSNSRIKDFIKQSFKKERTKAVQKY